MLSATVYVLALYGLNHIGKLPIMLFRWAHYVKKNEGSKKLHACNTFCLYLLSRR